MGTCKGSDYSSSAGVVNQSSYSFFSLQADWVDPWGIIFFDFSSHWSRTMKSRVKDLCEQADCWTGATFHVISCFVSLTDFSVVKATFCPLPPLSRQHPSYTPIKGGKSSIKTVGWRLVSRGRNYWIIKKCFSCYNFVGGLMHFQYHFQLILSWIFDEYCRTQSNLAKCLIFNIYFNYCVGDLFVLRRTIPFANSSHAFEKSNWISKCATLRNRRRSFVCFRRWRKSGKLFCSSAVPTLSIKRSLMALHDAWLVNLHTAY